MRSRVPSWEKTKWSAKQCVKERENILLSWRKWKLVPQWGTFQPVCITLAWKLNRIDQLVIYDNFLWHVLGSVCTIAMAVKELFIRPATSPHPAGPSTGDKGRPDSKWQGKLVSTQEIGGQVSSYSSASCTLSFQTEKKKPCRTALYI